MYNRGLAINNRLGSGPEDGAGVALIYMQREPGKEMLIPEFVDSTIYPKHVHCTTRQAILPVGADKRGKNEKLFYPCNPLNDWSKISQNKSVLNLRNYE